MSALNIQINSARKATQYESVKSIVLPSIKGEIEVLPEHMPLITELELGDVIIELSNGQKLDFLISRGYARIANNDVTLLLDEVDLSDELVKEEIEQAIANAEKMIGTSDLPPSELIQLEKRLRYERFKLNKSNL